MSEFVIEQGTLMKYTGSEEEVTVPKKVKIIDWHAFEGCSNLKKVVLPEKLNEIGRSAFWGCTALKEINIPPNVRLSNGAFDGCTSLMDDDGFIVIDGVFYNSPGLYESHVVKLPDGIKVIRTSSIDIRRKFDEVLWAKDRADLDRKRDEKVGAVIEIPASVERYGSGAFLGDIEEIISHSTAPFDSCTMSGCTKLKRITVPEGTEISEKIFGYSEADVRMFKKLTIRYL